MPNKALSVTYCYSEIKCVLTTFKNKIVAKIPSLIPAYKALRGNDRNIKQEVGQIGSMLILDFGLNWNGKKFFFENLLLCDISF